MIKMKQSAIIIIYVISIDTPQFTHSYDNNQFRLLWKFDDQKDTIYYHLRVKTTGWIGFGFARTAPNNMQGYDVIVGGFKDGQGYLNVSYFYNGHSVYKLSFYALKAPRSPLTQGSVVKYFLLQPYRLVNKCKLPSVLKITLPKKLTTL